MTEPVSAGTVVAAVAAEQVASELESDLLSAVEELSAATDSVLSSAGRAIEILLRDDRMDWYDHEKVTETTNALEDVMKPHEVVAARNMDTFTARVLRTITGKSHRPVGIRRNPLGRPGATHQQVFGRLANEYRWQQAKTDKMMLTAANTGRLPTALVEPIDAVVNRANRMVQTNLQLSSSRQALLGYDESRFVTGYRRIIHPELATQGTCGLCIAASDRRYRKKELLPIHPGCHCTVLPITDDFDPHSVNEIDFGKLYVDSGQYGKASSAEALRQTRYRVDENGEIGPVIRPIDEPIRTPRQVKKDTDHRPERDPIQALEEKRTALVDSLGVLQSQRQQFPQKYQSGRWDEIEGKMLDRIEKLKTDLRSLRRAA